MEKAYLEVVEKLTQKGKQKMADHLLFTVFNLGREMTDKNKKWTLAELDFIAKNLEALFK